MSNPKRHEDKMGTRRLGKSGSPDQKRGPRPLALKAGARSWSLRLFIFSLLVTFAGGLMGCVPIGYTSKSVAQPQTSKSVSQPLTPNVVAPTQASAPPIEPQIMLQAAQGAPAEYKDYKVGPEDLLVIEVMALEPQKGPEGVRTREVRVNGQGQISMPLVGIVSVGGLTTMEIEQRLKELYGTQYLRNPQVSVEVKEFHHQRVAVTGAVAKPGYYEIIGPRSLLEVLALAGGLSNKPQSEAGDVIHVIRQQNSADLKPRKPGAVQSFAPRTQTTVIDIARLVSGQAPELNIRVEGGDVVYVPFAGTAYVLGGVRKPGNVTVKENLTVSQAVAAAGGVDPLLGTTKIAIMRFDEQGRPLRIESDLEEITSGKAPDIPVKYNDAIVVVEGGLKKKLWVLRQIFPIPSGGYAIPTQ